MPPPPPQPALWFDRLPPELRAHIALYVSGGRQTDDALALAEAAPPLRTAVLDALAWKCCLVRRTPNAPRWVSAFASTARELRVSQLAATSVARLFNAPRLRRASITGDFALLHAVAAIPSLRELEFVFTSPPPLVLLLETLETLALSKLSITCGGSPTSKCPFFDVSAIPIFCPDLTSLKFSCSCGHRKDPLWQLLPRLPMLREITIDKHPPPDAVELLRALDAVHITCAASFSPWTFPLATRLGPPVRTFQGLMFIEQEDVLSLQKCPNLRTLSILLADGSEQPFVDVVASLRQLTTLDLCFAVSRHASPDRSAYFKPSGAWVSRLLHGTPQLTSLALNGICISPEHISRILKTMAARLESFAVNLDAYCPCPLGQLVEILHVAAKHNPNLRKFVVYWDPLSLTDEEYFESVLKEHEPVIRSALERLHKAAPLVDTLHFESTWLPYASKDKSALQGTSGG